MGGGAWKTELPWLNKSFTRQAVELVSVHRSAMTGVYMCLPISVKQLGSANVEPSLCKRHSQPASRRDWLHDSWGARRWKRHAVP